MLNKIPSWTKAKDKWQTGENIWNSHQRQKANVPPETPIESDEKVTQPNETRYQQFTEKEVPMHWNLRKEVQLTRGELTAHQNRSHVSFLLANWQNSEGEVTPAGEK